MLLLLPSLMLPPMAPGSQLPVETRTGTAPTNQFDGSGNFSFTQTVSPGTPQLLYIVRYPLP